MNASFDIEGFFLGGPGNCATVSHTVNSSSTLLTPEIEDLQVLASCENQFLATATIGNPQPVRYQAQIQLNGGAWQNIQSGRLPNVFQLDLPPIPDGASVCFRLNSLNICDGTFITGVEQCIDEVNVDPVQNLYSSFTPDGIAIMLKDTTLGSYEIARSANGSSFSVLTQTTSDFVDDNLFTGRQYRYQVSYLDTCNLSWGTLSTQPPYLTENEVRANEYAVNLDPAIHGLANNFTYHLEIMGNGNQRTLPFTSNPLIVSLGPEFGNRPRAFVAGNNGDVTIRSNEIRLRYEISIFVPTAFTPNGDGLNDRLTVFGLGTSAARLRIYTRTGQMIHETYSNDPGWDGRLNGTLVDEGPYSYEIMLEGFDEAPIRGTFMVLKK